jgi:xanthine dehydrogenase molybdopterin-binding subunit B
VCGEIVKDEEVFASKSVKFIGQPIGLVVAEDELTARRAARLVTVLYRVTEPPVITLQVQRVLVQSNIVFC